MYTFIVVNFHLYYYYIWNEIADGSHWELGKIQAPDGIWTHDPP